MPWCCWLCIRKYIWPLKIRLHQSTNFCRWFLDDRCIDLCRIIQPVLVCLHSLIPRHHHACSADFIYLLWNHTRSYSAKEVIFNGMRYINLRFTYLLTYFLYQLGFHYRFYCLSFHYYGSFRGIRVLGELGFRENVRWYVLLYVRMTARNTI